MVASGNTFRTHLGRVNRDMSRLLHVAPHDTEALVYSDYSSSLYVSGYNFVVNCQRGTLFPPLNGGAPASVQALMLSMLQP